MPEKILDVQSTDVPEGQGVMMTVSHPSDFGQYFLPAFSTAASDIAIESLCVRCNFQKFMMPER